MKVNPDKIPVRLAVDRWNVTVSPYVIRIDPARPQQIEWVCKDHPLEVRFPEGKCPFEGGGSYVSKRPGEAILSGPIRAGLKPKDRFPYEFHIIRKNGHHVKLPGEILVAADFSSKGVLVLIKRDGSGTLSVDPDPVTVHRQKDERIEWQCEFDHHRFEINFDKGDGTPFEQGTFGAEKGSNGMSGPWKAKSEVLKSHYDYSVRVWLSETDANPLVLDPGVDVDDGGGTDDW